MAKGLQIGSCGSQLSASSGRRALSQSSLRHSRNGASIKMGLAASSKFYSTASYNQPSQGARSVVIGTRQMLYRADPYQIDIQIEPKPGTNRLVITGQLLDLSHPGIIGRDIQVTLSNHRGHSVIAATNQFGEFSGEIENSGDLELSIPGDGDQPIVISLRNALGNLPGGKT